MLRLEKARLGRKLIELNRKGLGYVVEGGGMQGSKNSRGRLER